MPKREKTPPPGDDEPKYLSIYNPFPPHSTLEEEANVKACARWLACFIGKDNLWALFHKPSSPNVIIVEINPELTDEKMRQILGEHDWDEVFVTREADDYTSSKVFMSTFDTRREVEKTGWRTIDIVDEIFKGFNPSKARKIAYPYPETSFCEPPLLVGEVNALRLFRYLPANLFPEAARKQQTPAAEPPKPAARVVPGSAPPGLPSGAKAGLGGKGKKNKKNGTNADPTVRLTAPLARSIESSAKAKAIHRQPAPVSAAMYNEDSDDDATNYMAAHPGPNRPANWDGKFEDEESKKQQEKEQEQEKGKGKGKSMEDAYGDEEDDDEEGWGEVTAKFAGVKIKEKDGPVCPEHGKRCKSGICEWAKEQKRIQKRISQKQNETTGQWVRKW